MQARLDGRTIRYDVHGSGGEALVFIHALGVTRAMWKPQIDHFATQYLVVACDAGGHDAEGEEAAALTLRDRALDVEAVLDAIGVTGAHIVGLSMGGMIAQWMGIDHPDRVKSLVLAGTTARYTDEARRQLEDRVVLVEREGMSAVADTTMERWFTAPFRASNSDTVNWIRSMIQSADPAAYAAATRAVAHIDTLAHLPQIGAPTLILSGDEDATITPDVVAALRDRIRNAEVRTISGAAHLCSVQDPDTFNRDVAEFVSRVIGEQDADTGLASPAAPW